MSGLRVHLLGEVRIEHGSRSPSPIRITRSLQSLLAYLLLQRHRCHAREVLSGLFWGDQPEERARGCLSTALWRLRRLLEPPSVRRGTYLINTPQGDVGFNRDSDCWLDVAVLEDASSKVVGQPVTAASPAAVTGLEEAVKLYRGGLLEGVYADWALAERERLHTLYLDGLTWLMRYHAAAGSPEQSFACGQQILRHDPLREEIHRELIRLYISTGQRGLARHQYETCRKLLLTELGAEPLGETKALYMQLAPIRPMRSARRAEEAPAAARAAIEALRQVARTFDLLRAQLDEATRALETFASPAPMAARTEAPPRDRRVTRA